MSERSLTVLGGHQAKLHIFEGEQAEHEAADFLSKRLSSRWDVGSTVMGSLAPQIAAHERPFLLGMSGVMSAHVGRYDDNPYMDRGLLWLSTADYELYNMQFNLADEHGMDRVVLEGFVRRVFERGEEFAAGVAAGLPNPPYSQDWTQAEPF